MCTEETKNGPEKYYSYILIYVDNILCIHHDPNAILTQIDKYFLLKPGSVGEPDVYSWAKLKLMQLENGVWAWGLSPSKNVQEAVHTWMKYVEEILPKFHELIHLVLNLFHSDYWPEHYMLPELPPEHALYYQSLMRIYRWMIKIGMVDILTELSMLSSHMTLPCQGHYLEAALHIMSYLSWRIQPLEQNAFKTSDKGCWYCNIITIFLWFLNSGGS